MTSNSVSCNGIRARSRGAESVSPNASRILGQPRNPHLIPWRDCRAAAPGHDRQHGFLLRVHPGAWGPGRRRHHGGREHPPSPGSTRRRPPRRHRRRAGNLEAGDLRRLDDRGGVPAPAVRARRLREDLPHHSDRGDSLPAVFAARVAGHPAGPPGAHSPQWTARPVAPFPAARCQRTHVAGSKWLRTGPGGGSPLALRHGGRRPVQPDADHRHRPEWMDQLPILPVDRERVHECLGHDAVGHAGRGDLGSHCEIRGGRCKASRQVERRDRHGLFPTRGDGHRRSALAGDWRPAGRLRPPGWRGRPPGRDHDRAGAGRVANVLERATRLDVAR